MKARRLAMRRVSLVFATLALTALAAHADQKTVHRTFNVGSGGTLHVDADVGDVHVMSGSAGVVTVVTIEVTRRGKSEDVRDDRLTFDQNGNDVMVRSRAEHESSWFRWS
jgi:hypothetical protein